MDISNYIGKSQTNDELDKELFYKFRKYIYDHSRISLGDNKMDLLKSRFTKLIKQRKLSGFKEYYNWMVNDSSGEALREVMNAISTNLTSFFREQQHFEYLGKEYVAHLTSLVQKGRMQKKIRGWSAGCSTGEEIFTITITLLENLPDYNSWDIKLLASDLDTEVVSHGHKGIYGKERLQGIPKALIDKYFNSYINNNGKQVYQVKDFVRKLIAFRFLNLFSQWPFKGQFDFIFCRNVMIYFDRKTQEQLVNKFHQYLVPGGLLFIGHSESLNALNHPFGYIKPTIYIKNS